MNDSLHISAILPCFEEAPHLKSVVDALTGSLRINAPHGWEIVMVASRAATDGTPALAEQIAASDTHIRLIQQPVNDPGYGRACALGFAAAVHPWLLLTDADGQFDHSELANLVVHTGTSRLVAGYRSPRQDPWPRRMAGRVYTASVCRLMGLPVLKDLDCAFKLVHVDSVGPEPLKCRTGLINAEILARGIRRGNRIEEVPVSHYPRRSGHSRFEVGLGPLRHAPHPAQVIAMLGDLAGLLARKGES